MNEEDRKEFTMITGTGRDIVTSFHAPEIKENQIIVIDSQNKDFEYEYTPPRMMLAALGSNITDFLPKFPKSRRHICKKCHKEFKANRAGHDTCYSCFKKEK